MMTQRLKIKGKEHVARYVRFRDMDARHGNRSTVTIVTSLPYEEVVDLFTEPGEWSVTYEYEPKVDGEGNVVYQEPERVVDCTDYEKLLRILDTRTGLLEVVVSKMTDGEALTELRDALNG